MKKIASLVVILLCIAGIGLGGAFAWKKYKQRQYRETVVRVSLATNVPEGTDMAKIAGKQQEMLRSPAILGAVVDEMDLATVWGVDREKAMQRATKRLRVRPGEEPRQLYFFYQDRNPEAGQGNPPGRPHQGRRSAPRALPGSRRRSSDSDPISAAGVSSPECLTGGRVYH